ncbi:tRNA nucleotidyltransferase, partial [Blautia faecis]|nr:tRNA nucleotidyltransferase [Blautia faecis]
ASRRDLTSNELIYEIRTGKIHDFFHGQEDIEKRTLRMVSETTFIEDPLRVLRTAQFASRLDFCIETATKLMC